MPALLCKPSPPCDRAPVGIADDPDRSEEDQAYRRGADPAAAAAALAGDPAHGWVVVRACLDRAGAINAPADGSAPVCSLRGDPALLDAVQRFCALPAERGGETLQWSGSNALDLLARCYDGATRFAPALRQRYQSWRLCVPGLQAVPPGRFRWSRVLAEAQAPATRRASDSGYDLTLVAAGERAGAARFYRTGIRIQPAFGWYFDLVPRSSIARTGHILANSVGVIDRGYTGEVLVPLIKVDPEAADLALPARIVQIVPRPIVHVDLEEVPALDDTQRGDGGFGSTGR
jgi:deoxyuridine 5'-triphosphate nucleotidohydrolase